MEEAIAKKKIELKMELSAYVGDDRFKLMFDYLTWLDETYGRKNCPQEFNLALEETLKNFYGETKYYDDDRFIKLVIFYSEMRNNPEAAFATFHKKCIGMRSSEFYRSWANEYCKMGKFMEADQIFKIGFTNNATPKIAFENFYKQFLQGIGKKYLSGQLFDNNSKLCSKCSKIEEKAVEEDKIYWEINPLVMNNKDDFECPVTYPEEEDPNKQPMYPKNEVYCDGKEYSLEELKAIRFYKKSKELERKAASEISPKKIKKADESTYFDSKKDRSASIQRSIYGDITKEAMDVIQEMWNSPGLATAEKYKENAHKKDVLSNDTPVRTDAKKSTHFVVYTEDSMEENYPPRNNLASVTKPVTVPKQKAFSNSMAENHLPYPVSLPKPYLLSEMKTPIEKTMMPRQLPFQPVYANNGLTHKMSLATIDNKPTIPVDEEDTCNTKAFAFLLPSSTPVQLKKSQNQAQNQDQKHNGSYIEETEEKNEKVETNQELSIIMEASKERFSSSSNSNGSSNPPCAGMNKDKLIIIQNRMVATIHEDLFGNDSLTYDYFPLIVPEHNSNMISCLEHLDETMGLICVKKMNNPTSVLCKTYVEILNNESSVSTPKRRKTVESVEESETENLHRSKCKKLTNNSSKKTKSLKRKLSMEKNYTEVKRPLKFEAVDNPFSRDLNEWFLSQMNFPLPYQSENYHKTEANIPAMSKTIRLGDQIYTILNEIGKGAYARIMRAKTNNKNYALKVERPACNWEYYISKEIQKRVDPRMKSSFVNIEGAFVYKNGSILKMDWAQYGTLLSVITEYKQKTGKLFTRSVILHFAIEMIDIIYTLQKAKIIHGDIKPDNFVLKHMPFLNETESCVQLIDFGRSIDMTLFSEGTQFKYVVNTDGFQCNEMKENKPWTYQTDLYGLAGSLYCLLVGNYMKVVKKNDEWKLLQLLPRSVKRDVWDPIFKTLLNSKSPESLNDLLEIKSILKSESESISHPSVISMDFKQLHNVVNGN